MFANKNLFDDDVDVDARGNAAYQNSRPMTAASSSPSHSPVYSSQTIDRPVSSSLASGMHSVGSLDDLPSTPTPAMRKAKMEEMRRAQLDKRKQKSLAAPAVLRANADQLTSTPSASPAAVRHAPAPLSSPSSRPQSSPRGELNFSPRRDEYDSDDEGEGGVIGIEGQVSALSVASSSASGGVGGGPNLSNLLAEKRTEHERKNISRAERDMLEQGIAPVFDPVKPMAPGVKLDFSDMRAFLVQPVPKGSVFQCYILRNKKGIKNKLYPTYEAYVSGEDRFLLAARKRTKNKSSNYMISMDQNNVGGKESASYLGKVRSNWVGTEFTCYDSGINPKDLDSESADIGMMSVRQELGAVFYEPNILGSKGPRKMTAVVPSMRKDGHRTSWKPMRPEESVVARYKAQPSATDFMPLVNKTPKWSEQLGAYVLNFNGRVTQASVKNFQLINNEDPENVLLQFGRIGKDTFTMDLQYPLSPLQAFSICLTSLDYKLACE